MSDYTPNELDFIDTYVSAMSGGCTPIEDPERTAEARRGIAKVKADARNEVIDYMSRHYEGYLPLGWHRHTRASAVTLTQ